MDHDPHLPYTDIVLVRMLSESTKPPSARHYYANGIDGLVKLFREEGLIGMGRGLIANVVSNYVAIPKNDH